jgi:hypothetical protein
MMLKPSNNVLVKRRLLNYLIAFESVLLILLTGVAVEVRHVGHYHGSRVTDPVTGFNRRVSHRPLWHQQWDIRYDMADLGLVYGASFGVQDANFDYFFNEIRRQQESTRTTIFIEYSKFKLGTIRFQVNDMAGFRRDRFIYAGTRASGSLAQTNS